MRLKIKTSKATAKNEKRASNFALRMRFPTISPAAKIAFCFAFFSHQLKKQAIGATVKACFSFKLLSFLAVHVHYYIPQLKLVSNQSELHHQYHNLVYLLFVCLFLLFILGSTSRHGEHSMLAVVSSWLFIRSLYFSIYYLSFISFEFSLP